MKRLLLSNLVNRYGKFAIGTLFLFALGLGAYQSQIGRKEGKAQLNFKSNRKALPLDDSISLASHYLVHACKPDGQFVYQVSLYPGVDASGDYNVVRHAGAIYALTASYKVWPRGETRQAVLRASRFLRQRCLAPVPGHPELLAVWPPVLDGTKATMPASDKTAGLGAAGLGLIALLSVEKVQPGTTSLRELRRLGRFIVSLQQTDGRFRDRYFPGVEKQPDISNSLYYPGEAALALTMLYEKDPSPLWLEHATKAMDYLMRVRRGKTDVPADCWALIATARLLPLITGNQRLTQELTVHAVQICRGILAGKPKRENALRQGCLTDDGRTTPTAARLEGLQAALTFLPTEQGELRSQIEEAVRQGIGFLLRAQIRSGRFKGGIPEVIFAPDTDFQVRKAPVTDGQIRIDYVQHALSAMLQFRETMKQRENLDLFKAKPPQRTPLSSS